MEWFNPSDWNALILTLKVAIIATLIALLLGVSFGYLFARTHFFGKNFFDAILMLPMVLPPTVLGYYLIVLLGRRSVFGIWLEESFGIQLIFTWQGAVIAATIVSFPLVFKSARAAFEDVDKNLERTAKTLGSNEIILFFRINFPLARRGIIAGTLLAFARSMGEFGATLMIAGNLPNRTQTLSIAIYDAVQSGDDARAKALVILISIVCVAILAISGALLTPKRQL